MLTKGLECVNDMTICVCRIQIYCQEQVRRLYGSMMQDLLVKVESCSPDLGSVLSRCGSNVGTYEGMSQTDIGQRVSRTRYDDKFFFILNNSACFRLRGSKALAQLPGSIHWKAFRISTGEALEDQYIRPGFLAALAVVFHG